MKNINAYRTRVSLIDVPNDGNNTRQMTDEQLKQLFDKDDNATNEDHIAIIDSKVNKMDTYTKEELEDMLEAYYHHDPETASIWIQQEKARQKNEEDRKVNETNRQENYNTLKGQAEEKIQDLENRKVQFDSNEEIRKSNETLRISKENERKSAETTRQANESTRVSDETVRSNNENDRKKLEQIRIDMENGRKSKEEERITQERLRVEAEEARKNAENVRVTQEGIRQEQESQRQTSITNMQSSVTAKIENVEDRMGFIETNFDELVTGTGFATVTYVDDKVAGLVNSAPEALDTLQELANALGNDPNFATTVSTEIGKRAYKEDVYTKSQTDDLINSKTQIDDNKASATTVWSSQKTSTEINKKSPIGHGHSMSDITGLVLTATNVTIEDTDNYFASTTVEGALKELYAEVVSGKTRIVREVNDIINMI